MYLHIVITAKCPIRCFIIAVPGAAAGRGHSGCHLRVPPALPAYSSHRFLTLILGKPAQNVELLCSHGFSGGTWSPGDARGSGGEVWEPKRSVNEKQKNLVTKKLSRKRAKGIDTEVMSEPEAQGVGLPPDCPARAAVMGSASSMGLCGWCSRREKQAVKMGASPSVPPKAALGAPSLRRVPARHERAAGRCYVPEGCLAPRATV